ncbi:MAG: hypothetical protein KME45_29465 [Stenomitos rutilans HA7619-LM2]|jgi:hypothetical protein|nr:hypothetical protein [Stenomitos rutilans HA7619-LM2]
MTHASNGNLSPKMDVLIDQVGKLTEGITEFRLSMKQSTLEFRADLTEIKAVVQQQSDTDLKNDGYRSIGG